MTKRLFIIGNGFDISHKLKTSYDDFEQWVSNRDKELYSNISFMMKEHNKFVRKAKDKLKWADFEKSFHEIIQGDWGQNFIEESIQEYLSDSGDPNFSDSDWGALVYELEEQLVSLSEVKTLFKEWIISIIEPNIKKHSPKYVFNKEDMFFSFNYTTTLETIYKIEESNIYHVHGDYQNVIVGHNGTFVDNFSKEYNSENDSIMVSDAIDSISTLHADLSKDVDKQINKLKESIFFSGLKSVNKIYVLGHGYGEYDYPYYEIISKEVTNECVWNFYPHKPEDKKNLYKLLKKLPNIKYQVFDSTLEVFD
ncbi:AbiH family protein [Enterococcus mundtii]|uniref:Phage abortive infection protein n=1 Tax=Enterococcus mundtii TaxID=53346 RepID=A0A1V2UCH4_ENTMU|nr:AbiH family protein [Enterococcus mundtii]ONN40996.1 hypothetical protein BTN92_14200 [Enterococcus mundtii]